MSECSCNVNVWVVGGGTGLTVGSEEGWGEEALVHQRRERYNTNHVVCVEGQATERLTAQLLYREESLKVTDVNNKRQL